MNLRILFILTAIAVAVLLTIAAYQGAITHPWH